MAEINNTSSQSDDVYPVYPLPNPGEGGPVWPNTPPDYNTNPEIPDDPSQTPVIPLPNPGEGGPVWPNTPPNYNTNDNWRPIITVIPRPIIPCYFCSSTQYGTVRFLNTASAYNSFLIYIGNQLVVNSIASSEISQYTRVSAGTQTITVSGENGYVYIQKSITVRAGQAMTVAIIATASGLDLMEINDSTCSAGSSTACFRACNLSVTNQSVNVSLNNNYVTFQNLQYRQVTGSVYLPTGTYFIQVYNNPSTTGNPLVYSSVYVKANTAYTLYVFNWNPSTDAIRTMVVEDTQS